MGSCGGRGSLPYVGRGGGPYCPDGAAAVYWFWLGIFTVVQVLLERLYQPAFSHLLFLLLVNSGEDCQTAFALSKSESEFT